MYNSFAISLARDIHISRLNYTPVLSCYIHWLFPVSTARMLYTSLSEKHMDKCTHFGGKNKQPWC